MKLPDEDPYNVNKSIIIDSNPKMISKKDEVLFFKMTFFTFKYLAILNKSAPLYQLHIGFIIAQEFFRVKKF
jgi:hypothetical protein